MWCVSTYSEGMYDKLENLLFVFNVINMLGSYNLGLFHGFDRVFILRLTS